MNDMMVNRNAEMNDLVAEISKMDDEINYLEAELKKAERYKALADKLSDLWRDHLDEAELDGDNDWEKEARQILWNDSDSQKRREAEESDLPWCEAAG